MTSNSGPNAPERIRVVTRDGKPQWQLRCPGCDEWADIDDDQFYGRVSVEHSAGSDDQGHASSSGCGYHDTIDWSTTLQRPRPFRRQP